MNKASDEQLGLENEPHGWNKLTLTLNILSKNQGPDIAWFKDPAGNILSVLKTG
jgi:hypothetical protein